MASLSEFLERQAAELKPDLDTRRQIREEWVEAVDALVSQIKEWLAQADHNHVLEVEEDEHEKREQRIGHYVVKGLKVRLGATEVRVVPVARFVIPNARSDDPASLLGRVDLKGGESRYSIFRAAGAQGPRWMTIGDQNGPRDFDKESFESAMVSLLK